MDKADTRMDEVVTLLQENQWIYDFKLTHFFTDRVWEHMPVEWCEPLQDLSPDELAGIPYGQVKDSWPTSLKNFISKCLYHSIPRQLTLGKLDSSSERVTALDPVHADPAVKKGMSERVTPLDPVQVDPAVKMGMSERVTALDPVQVDPAVRKGMSERVTPLDPVHVDPAVKKGMSERVTALDPVQVDPAVKKGMSERVTALDPVQVDPAVKKGMSERVTALDPVHVDPAVKKGMSVRVTALDPVQVDPAVRKGMSERVTPLDPVQVDPAVRKGMSERVTPLDPVQVDPAVRKGMSERVTALDPVQVDPAVKKGMSERVTPLDPVQVDPAVKKGMSERVTALDPVQVDPAVRKGMSERVTALDPVHVDPAVRKGMSDKKLHEVCHMTAVIDHVTKMAGNDVIVDVGSGLGYLGQVLHTNYGRTVLGLEGKQCHTSGAERRAVTSEACPYLQNITCELYPNRESMTEFSSLFLDWFSKLPPGGRQCPHQTGLQTIAAKTSCKSNKFVTQSKQEDRLRVEKERKFEKSTLQQNMVETEKTAGTSSKECFASNREGQKEKEIQHLDAPVDIHTNNLNPRSDFPGDDITSYRNEWSSCEKVRTANCRDDTDGNTDLKCISTTVVTTECSCEKVRTANCRDDKDDKDENTEKVKSAKCRGDKDSNTDLQSVSTTESSSCKKDRNANCRNDKDGSTDLKCISSTEEIADFSRVQVSMSMESDRSETEGYVSEGKQCVTSEVVGSRQSLDGKQRVTSGVVGSRQLLDGKQCVTSEVVGSRQSLDGSGSLYQELGIGRSVAGQLCDGRSSDQSCGDGSAGRTCGEKSAGQLCDLRSSGRSCGDGRSARQSCGDGRSSGRSSGDGRSTEESWDGRSTEQSCSDGRSAGRSCDDGTVCMVGLHCCGDLTPTMLRCFKELDFVGSLCCVSCCYHRMTFDDSSGHFNQFPMSTGLQRSMRNVRRRHPNWALNVYSMRLAAQETRARWQHQTIQDHEKHRRNVAYRGLLEMCLEQGRFELQKAARRLVHKPALADYQTYVDTVAGQIISTDSTDVDRFKSLMYDLHEEHKAFFSFIEPITALQVLLQPVLESLIYTDRLQWLHENGYHGNIVPIFDEYLSPRNLAIVVIK